MIESIAPKDKQAWLKLRAKDITSTEAAALFGASPYMTKFELWHRKKEAEVVAITEGDRMKWGTRLQDAIAEGIAQDQGWKVRRMDEYMRDSELRIGASFDYEIIPDGLLEIKNVDSLIFKDGWIVDEDKNIEAPPHIELQGQHQLLVSGRKHLVIGALVGGNRVVLLKREPDLAIHARIKEEVAKFWKSIADNKPPKPDFAKDAAFIAEINSYAEVGKTISAEDNVRLLADEYKEYGQAEKEAAAGKAACKAEILTLIGDAEKVKGDRFSISAGMVAGGHVEYDRKPFRTFRINWRKEKKA